MTYRLGPSLRRCLHAMAAFGFFASVAACGATPTGAAQTRAVGVQARAAQATFKGGVASEDQPLELAFTTHSHGEALLDLDARVPGSDWEAAGREAVTVRLTLDGSYNQDVVLYAGERSHRYRLALGGLAPGPHQLRIERLATFSAAGLQRVEIEGGSVSVVDASDPDFDLYAHAPIIMSREAPHRTDTPLLLAHEHTTEDNGGRGIRYTLLLSNEDGGTATRALMARWGRTVDIDWAYAIRWNAGGRVESETYQGRWHFTKRFRGKYEGRHPILRLSTDNNCYDDEGQGPLRFRLAPHEAIRPALAGREDVVDRHPWIYGLMAKELFRERKAHKDHFAPRPDLRPDAIGDPRRYVYVEFLQDNNGPGLGVEVTLKGETVPSTSHRGDDGLTARRDGWCRVAVELPRQATLADVARIELVGLGGGAARVTAVRRVLSLDADYQPQFWPLSWSGDALLKDKNKRLTIYAAP